ncbi:MAG TPA: PAS domain-containing protein [Dehalococcoidia bacterium]|nr:PAS domain-containing protein [Dehalococcoidia bacterium]
MPLSSKTLAKIVNGSAIPLFVINKEHKITHWNNAVEALSGRKREDVLGKDDHWMSFYKEKRPSMADLIVEGASAEEIEVYYQGKCKKSPLIEDAYEAEDFFSHLGDKGIWLHFTASPIKDDDGEIIGAIETLVDITERKNLEDNLRFFLQQITRAQEEERKYIARELHDDMAQILGSLSRRLDNLLRKKHDFGESEAAALHDVQNLLNQGMQSLNSFIQNLRPSLLDDLGLIPALRSLTNNLESTDGTIADFRVIGEERRLSNEIELSLFRIVQEALNNVSKHADATEVHVTAEFNGKGIKITVSDNGKGFELRGSMDDLPRIGQLGLMGMQERVWLLGGSIDVDSKPGRGTTLEVEVPA